MRVDFGSDGSAEVVEVQTEDPDDMESVCDDPGVWKPPADDLPIGAGEVDADDSYSLTAFQGGKEGGKLVFAFALSKVKDAVIVQIAEGGNEPAFAVESVLVDSEHHRAIQIAALMGDSFGPLAEDPPCRGRTDRSAPRDGFQIDPVLVVAVDLPAELLG